MSGCLTGDFHSAKDFLRTVPDILLFHECHSSDIFYLSDYALETLLYQIPLIKCRYHKDTGQEASIFDDVMRSYSYHTAPLYSARTF